MKKLKIVIAFVFAAMMFGCSDDDTSIDSLENAGAPTAVSALFTITQDNTGNVTITPKGEGVVNYEVHFGDGTAEPVQVAVGRSAMHTYAEGVYNVKIIATGINGKTTEITEVLTVSFLAPTDLDVTITHVAGNAFKIEVGATAQLETFFEVTFGEDPAQAPVQFMEGGVASHTYAAVGNYEVTVTAYSGGAATAVYTETVTIVNPLLLPITFENTTLNYVFADFGNAATSVVDNPDTTGMNTSAKVGKSIKQSGAETWAGTTIILDGTIDFSQLSNFRMKVLSPQSGVTVRMKLENISDATMFAEVDQVTTVTNQWEYLTFDFSGANLTREYSKIVLFFNFDVAGSGDVYHFDDIEMVADPIELPITFETANINYNVTGFGDATGATVANPHNVGINTSANVGQMVKPNNSQTWAGVFVSLSSPIDFTAMQKVKMKVWSTAPGTQVLLKLENFDNSGIFVEELATTTVTNGWEELTYDFTGINNSNNYQKVVVFFDYGTAGTGATYYFDDIKLSN